MAARYRKVDPRIWDDEKFQPLDLTDKTIVLYLLTGPQTNRIGLYRFSPGMATEHLRLSAETFLKRFGNVCSTFGWRFDGDRMVLYIPTWWKYNRPENPNVLKGNLEDLHEVPQTALMADFAANVAYLKPTLHPTLRETFAQTLPQTGTGTRAGTGGEGNVPPVEPKPGTNQPPAEDEPDPLADAREAARAAFDRWSEKGRGHAMDRLANECRPVGDLVESLSQDPPIVRGLELIPRHLLIPQAADVLRTKGVAFRSVKYAVGAVRSELEQWAREGVPGSPRGKPPPDAGPVSLPPTLSAPVIRKG